MSNWNDSPGIRIVLAATLVSTLCQSGVTADCVPPAGFTAVFNGRDLTGWYGWNPHASVTLTGAEKTACLARQRTEFPQHWTIENGELVNDGHGPYATTETDFGDIELLLDYKTVAGADSGIYLRGVPQVQIWDWNQPWDPQKPGRRPHLGSGGLFNNTPGATGRDPLVLADRPFGEWNRCRIRQIGAVTWVWLNDRLVVDGAVMENYWERGQPFPDRGPLMLQTHGGEIRWRNIFVRPIGEMEAHQALTALRAERAARLASAMTLHASFDQELDADFAVGDRSCYTLGRESDVAAPTGDLRLAQDAGRFGGALQFGRTNTLRPSYRDAGTLGYDPQGWSVTVSVWLRPEPDLDVEADSCKPVTISGDDDKKGLVFLEWPKRHSPQLVRYAIRPLFEIWNPRNADWQDIFDNARFMVRTERAPFSRDRWTHAVFTLEHLNDGAKPQVGRLYLNGALQGTLEQLGLALGWNPENVRLVLGEAYVGSIDDLAVFDRALTDGEVMVLHGLQHGIRDLR